MNQAKVNLLDEDQSSTHKKRKQNLILVLIIVFALIITSIVTVFTILKHHTESQSLSAHPTEAIRSACRVARYYHRCIKSLLSHHINRNHPIHVSDIIGLSIGAAFLKFYKINALPQELASNIKNANIKAELANCQSSFNDSLSQLNASLVTIMNHVGPDTRNRATDKGMVIVLRNLIAWAIDNVERCLDRLGMSTGTGTTQGHIGEIKKLVKLGVEEAEIYMVNSLAILENKDAIDEMFDPSVGSIFGFVYVDSGKLRANYRFVVLTILGVGFPVLLASKGVYVNN